MKFSDIKVYHTPDYPKSYNYVKDDALDKIKEKIDTALGEDCFLNYMTTDEKPYEDAENLIIRRLNKKIQYLKNRSYSNRKYIRLLHRIINFRDREIRELKRNQIVVNVTANTPHRRFGHVSSATRIMRQIKSRTENDKKE